MMKTLLFFFIFVILNPVFFLGPLASEKALWLRNTAISPDGKEIAFTYKGNLFKVSAKGGVGNALVLGEANYISNVHWSPKGDKIAMSVSLQNWEQEVYSIHSNGGNVERLTWNPGKDQVVGFSGDGKEILFLSKQLSNAKSSYFSLMPMNSEMRHQLFKIPVEGGKMEPLLEFPAIHAALNSDSSLLAYVDRFEMEQFYRKHQKSSVSPKIFLLDTRSGKHRQITEDNVSALNPVWGKNDKTLFYLSEKSGDFNVWSYESDTEKHRQLTFHEEHPVRHLSVSGNDDLAYSFNGEIHLLKNGSAKSEKIEVLIHSSLLPIDIPVSSPGIKHFDIRKGTKEGVAVTFGDLFVFDGETGETKQLTNTPYEEADAGFTPDGSAIIFSAQKENLQKWGIYVAVIDEDAESFLSSEKYSFHPVITGDFNATQPLMSPDGGKIAYLRDRNDLFVYDLESEKHLRVIPKDTNYSYSDGDLSYSWSPDSGFLAVEVQQDFSNREIKIFSVTPEKRENFRITYTSNAESFPQWHPNGNSIFYLSSQLSDFQADGSQVFTDVFQTFLSREARESNSAPSAPNEEENLSQSVEENSRQNHRKNKLLIEPEKFEELTRRVTRKSTLISYYSPVLGGNSVFFSALDELYDGSLVLAGYLINLEDGSIENIFEKPVSSRPLFKVIANGAVIVFFEGSEFGFFDLTTRELRAFPMPFSFVISIDERINAVFEQFSVFTQDKFYRPDMHGLDWEKYVKNYRRFLSHIDDAQDLSIILSEMVGELNASHTGSSYYCNCNHNPALQHASLGVIFDLSYREKGYKIDEILSGGPLDESDSTVKKGDILIAVNGVPVDAPGGYQRQIMGKAGKSIIARFSNPDTGDSWTQEIDPISPAEEDRLLYQNWVKLRQDYVEKKSNGKLGYAHIPAMNEASFRKFSSDVIAKFNNAQGLLVDIRFNMGGNLHNSLITFLTGRKYGQLKPRGFEKPILVEPTDRWYKPSILIGNSSSYSDGSVFPQSYQDLGIGKIVGDSIPGTGTAVWWRASNIIPGLVYGIPQLPFVTLDGRYYENLEVKPDIPVSNLPGEIIQGRDSQLDAAIEALLNPDRNP